MTPTTVRKQPPTPVQTLGVIVWEIRRTRTSSPEKLIDIWKDKNGSVDIPMGSADFRKLENGKLEDRLSDDKLFAASRLLGISTDLLPAVLRRDMPAVKRAVSRMGDQGLADRIVKEVQKPMQFGPERQAKGQGLRAV